MFKWRFRRVEINVSCTSGNWSDIEDDYYPCVLVRSFSPTVILLIEPRSGEKEITVSVAKSLWPRRDYYYIGREYPIKVLRDGKWEIPIYDWATPNSPLMRGTKLRLLK